MGEGFGLLDGLGGFSEGRMVGLMGTDVRVLAWAANQPAAEMAQEAAFEEMARLHAVFSIHDATSELSRWRRGEAGPVSDELATALSQAAGWFDRSGGVFHPACRGLYERWERAVDEGVVPSRDELRALAATGCGLPWRTGPNGQPQRTGDCSVVDLYAFVKGWIVDAGLRTATAVAGTTRVGVNAGGDLAHATDQTPWRVGVEDPRRPSDNGANRLCTLLVGNAAVATSGLARRGFRVGDAWFGHVLDPRTGWPVDHVAQVSVVAPDAATADALATVCGVLPLDEGVCFIEAADGCEALVVPADDSLPPRATSGWGSLLA